MPRQRDKGDGKKNKREAIKKAKLRIAKINPTTLIHRDYPGNKPDIDAEEINY